MDFLRCLLLFAGVFHVALCYRTRSHHCVDITSNTAPLCANLSLGYDKMMLPNFLRHDTTKEVRRELAQWSPLVGSGCHPYLKHFLCSVFAPVCMPELIPPCRSLCSMVQTSCEPIMRRHNYTWPSMLDCRKYPENSMCVKIEVPTSVPTSVPTTTGGSSVCEENGSNVPLDELQKKFCESDFAVRARVSEKKMKDGYLILKATLIKSLKRSQKRNQVQRLRIPIMDSRNCGYVNKRKQFLILGTKRGRRMIVTYLMKWKDFKNMRRKIKEKACRKM